MAYNNEYNFDFLDITELILRKNIYEIISHHKKINKLLTNEKVIPDFNLISTTTDDYEKFINTYIPDTNLWLSNLQSHLLLKVITDNLHINISTDLYYKIKDALSPNPTFYQLIFLNNIPRYEIKIYFNEKRAEKDLHNLLFNTYTYYFGIKPKNNKN